jgi:hypothetical protein
MPFFVDVTKEDDMHPSGHQNSKEWNRQKEVEGKYLYENFILLQKLYTSVYLLQMLKHGLSKLKRV